MKFNWGTGIFLFYTIFASSLFFQVYKSTQYDNSLVVDNYYEKDLAYQAQYEKEVNNLSLAQKLEINQQSGVVELQFPSNHADVQGTVLFYHPFNQNQDLLLPLVLDESQKMAIITESLNTGFWKVEVDWKAGGKAYFDRKQIKLTN